MQVGDDVLRAAGTVSTHKDPSADVATTLGSGQGTVGGPDQGDVVVGVVRPGVTRAHQHGQRFATQARAPESCRIDERGQWVEAVATLVGRCGMFFVGVDVDQRGIDVDDQRISPGRAGCGVQCPECVPGPGANGAHRPGHLVVDFVDVVGELMDPAVGGGHRANGADQARVDQWIQQVQVIQAGRTSGQGDRHRRQHRPSGVGDGVRSETREVLVENIGDTEAVGGISDQECAGACADRPVSGNLDEGVGSLPL